MKKLLLVDGHNLLFRMFYGMPDTFYTPFGRKYNAVYGFGSAIGRVLSFLDPEQMLVVFDSPDCGDRRKLDEAYKANRPDFSDADPKDCPFTQLSAIFALLDGMGIPNREIHGCEADDVIASYALHRAEDTHVVIFSTDRDYWQLISDGVSILNYRGRDSNLVTPEIVERKFGVRPDQFADFKCLIGDTSDNIVGVPGVGPKRAAELLRQFSTLEGIFDHLDDVPRPAVRKALEESRERLRLNRRLIRLDGEAPRPMDAEYLTFAYREPHNLLLEAMNLADACADAKLLTPLA